MCVVGKAGIGNQTVVKKEKDLEQHGQRLILQTTPNDSKLQRFVACAKLTLVFAEEFGITCRGEGEDGVEQCRGDSHIE